MATTTAAFTTRPSSRTFTASASSHTNGYGPPSSCRVRKAFTCSSRLLASSETCDLKMPRRPIASTRRSTFRVETPSTYDSTTTATSALSERRRGSRRKWGK